MKHTRPHRGRNSHGRHVVLTGKLNGDLVALDGKSGKVLFHARVGGPIGGGLVTYAARSVQHVAVVSGFVGIFVPWHPRSAEAIQRSAFSG